MTEVEIDDLIMKSGMNAGKVLKWMMDFGLDWVRESIITDTWADHELYWHGCVKEGYLEVRMDKEESASMQRMTEQERMQYLIYRYKLTQKALDLLKPNEGETENDETQTRNF